MTDSPEGLTDPEWIRIRLTLGYDGTGYAGWAKQPAHPTIQGEIEDALHAMDPAIGSVVCAGRTDAGVHARTQVIHVDVPRSLWAKRAEDGFVRQLNQLTGDQIHFRDAMTAPEGFDARFSALSRGYSYRLCDDSNGWDPLFRQWVTRHRRELDVSSMAKAAQFLLGEHDFTAFCKPRDGASTVRRMLWVDVCRDGGRRAVVSLEADAFCHSMVRSIVGALVAVGERRKEPDWIVDLLAAGKRDSAVTVMPPEGLVLETITYPPDELVAQRAAQTRRFRG